ncbi:MAG: adenylate/guanylate cyclase domain-containing protein [Chloroflexia bacterium]
MAGERRIVTILFCDVKGSTAMAEQLDPEEWAEIMNGVFQYLIEPVYRYEGTLARLMGDAILAFFGAPIAHEDDPQRAVLAALGIVQGIRPQIEKIKKERGLDLDVRVGINTGLVVVGEVGSDLRVEYTAMGDAVNLASRMEQTAEPGTVQISANTYKSVSNLFEFRSLGGIEVKGKAEAVEAYQVLSVREGARPTRGIEGLSSPLVGRDRELGTLRSCLEDLMVGRGQIISVTGEAGLGKSRLVSELRKWAAPTALRWHEGRSMSYETSTPYAPFIYLFGDMFALRGDDTDAERYDKVHAGVAAAMPGQELEVAPFIATLLDITLPSDYAERVTYLEPPFLRGRIFHSVIGFIEAIANREPVVLMFEDLHWVDHTSLELIEQLLPITDRVMLMMLALFRPQAQEPSWRFHEIGSRDYVHRYTRVALKPLGEAGSRELVANLLEIEDLPEKVRALILRKAEGNPFFVEEVIRSLLDARLVVREDNHWRATREIETIAVPDTLAGVITARLDRLDEEAKHVAQTASVIGREFDFDVLSQVYEAPQVVDASLSSLQRRELVRERSRIPRRLYLFQHVLTQETAYASVLLSKRRELHLRVGECLERVEPEHVHDIARHLLEAREEARALPYLVEAGDRAARAASREEAIGYYRKALDIAQRVVDVGLARRAYEGLGKTLEFAMDIPGALQTYGDMKTYAEEHGDVPMKVSALNKMSYVTAFMLGEFQQADQQLTDAERAATEHDDEAGLAEMFTVRCYICTAVADFSNAERYLSEAVRMGRKLEQERTVAFGLSHKANTLMYMTEFDEGWKTAQEGLRYAEEVGDMERQAEIKGGSMSIHLLVHQGDLNEARRVATEGYELAMKIGVLFPPCIAAYIVGTAAHWQGDYEQALEWYGRGLASARPVASFVPFLTALQLGPLSVASLDVSHELASKSLEYQAEAAGIMETPYGAVAGGSVWPDLGLCAIALGETERAAQYFQNGLTMPSFQMYLQRPRSMVGVALVALARGQVEEAAKLQSEAHNYAHEHGLKCFYPMIELAGGKVSTACGNLPVALQHFERAETLAAEMGMRPQILRAREGAANVLAGLGRDEEAKAKLDQARSTIEEIAALFKNESYREMYLKEARATVGGRE